MVTTSYYNTQSGNSETASRNQPCPLCGRDRYCFLGKDEDGEIFKVWCKWTDLLEGWHKVGVCQKDERNIFIKDGYKLKRKRSKNFPELIKLTPELKDDFPQWQEISKDGRGAKELQIEYLYPELSTNEPLGKMVRKQWQDRRPAYKGKTKCVLPHHWVNPYHPDQGTQGWWSDRGKGDKTWPLYRQVEAQKTIRSGGFVFAVGGEQAVEFVRSLGLVGVSNQGGEGGYRQIASDLAPAFAEAIENQMKPLLVVWPDNDETGYKTFGEKLVKECYKHGVTSVAINPLALWSDMPPHGDAKDWIEHCKESGVSNEEMIRALEFAIDEAIDQHEEELRQRWQREAWNAPVSHKGEIGRWIEKKDGEDTKKEWKPLCNFDLQVECELEDASGGGLVLQVKRSFEQRQYRVILNSINYTSVDKFVDALKTELGTGVVCNLTKHELGALIHTRLHEYRTNRSGKIYKRIDRYGQQVDGTWVFRDRQYLKDGQLTSEEQTGWVFSNVSSEGDEIPCPELAPENPLALKSLVDTARQFFGVENFYQTILMMGWVVAGLHSQDIFKEKRWFPLINAYGEPGSCKTLASEAALSLVGTNWAEEGMLARASTSAIYEHGSRTGSLSFIWDDPARDLQNEEIAKTWANRKARVVRKNRQEPHSPMGLTSNHVFGGDQAATFTRLIRLPFERSTGGIKTSFQELQAAQRLASGAFSTLLKIGYPMDAIASIERELLSHLPKAHARIAQALAIVTYYAQQVLNLAESTEDIKRWVIDRLCPNEDDADSAGDSLQDFIDKVLSLESESLVGDWNKQKVTARDGQEYIALHYSDVWALVDKQFKPATYNLKSLKPLVVKAGGKVDNCVQKFDDNRDESLAFHRASLSPRVDSNGNKCYPNPPRKTGRKAWLLPVSLFGGSDDESNDAPNPKAPSSNNEELSQVTSSYQELLDFGNSQKLDVASNSAIASSQVTKLPNINETKTNELMAEDESSVHKAISEDSFVTPVTQAETQPQKGFQEVTRDGNSVVTGNLDQSLTTAKSISSAVFNQMANGSPAIAETTANNAPSQRDLAIRILQCQTWVAAVEAVDTVSVAINRKQDLVFEIVVKLHMSDDNHRHLVRLLADHIQQFPRDQSAYNWLPKSCSWIRDEAIALVRQNKVRRKSPNG